MSILDPDKSVDYYAFVGGSGLSVAFDAPTDWGEKQETHDFAYAASLPMNKGTLNISETDIAMNQHSGRFQWSADQVVNGASVARGSAFWEIAPLTGNMQTDYAGSPIDMMQTPFAFSASQNWALSYGFYDSGCGLGGVTNHDQSWVYFTPDMSRWMTRLVGDVPALADLPFSSWVLPGAHDAGTYDTRAMTALCQSATFLDAAKKLASNTKEAIALMAIPNDQLPIFLVDFFVTQKDSVSGMLDMGVRYFDFRPGYCWSGTGMQSNGVIYHQHAYLPFAPMQDFLDEMFAWLVANPNEIAVVSFNFQGFVEWAQRPQASTINTAILNTAGRHGIALGYVQDLPTSYRTLIANNKRVIFLNQINDSDPQGSRDNTVKYDSYVKKIYDTVDVAPILKQLGTMNVAGQTKSGSNYTVLQLQATAQSDIVGDIGTVTKWSRSGSPLMSTKAMFDNQTYPWLIANVRKNLGQAQLVVFLNDFSDNALAMHARTIMQATKPG